VCRTFKYLLAVWLLDRICQRLQKFTVLSISLGNEIYCGRGESVKVTNNNEISKWRWYALAVTVLGIIVYSLPWLSSRSKILLTIPLYAMFVYVYYKYICLKKAAQPAVSAKEDSPDLQKITPEQNANKNAVRKGKTTSKKGR
jgi:hypothetical protein